MTPEEEVEALRALLRRVRGAVGHWAALSYVETSGRWSEKERELLRRAFAKQSPTNSTSA